MQVDRKLFCAEIPHGVTSGQAVAVVVRYGETHPEQAHVTFIALALTALREAWPCKDQR